jgi:hypothetical protein
MPEACSIVKETRNLTDGFDKIQEKKLKGRSRANAADRWKDIYCILFEKDRESPDIPSPCKYAPV